jgi:hypothetical protein
MVKIHTRLTPQMNRELVIVEKTMNWLGRSMMELHMSTELCTERKLHFLLHYQQRKTVPKFVSIKKLFSPATYMQKKIQLSQHEHIS